MRIRERHFPYASPVKLGTVFYKPNPYTNDWAPQYDVTQNIEGHYWRREVCHDELHHGPPWRSGGPLNKWDFASDQFDVKGSVSLRAAGTGYDGGFLPMFYPASYLTDTWSQYCDQEFDVSSYGATGWNKFQPLKPSAGLGVFLGELRELPRMLMTTASLFNKKWIGMGGSRTSFGPKRVADHWLNTQFGWRPFLSDLQKFWKTTSNLYRLLQQRKRDNGRWVRRGGNVSVQSSEEVLRDYTGFNVLNPSLPYFLTYPYGDCKVVSTTSHRVWFRGRFKYWIPNIEDPWTDRNMQAHIFGLSPSPGIIWDLLPWSWLVDWCSNAGDVIDNIAATSIDGLVADYAYVMGTESQSVTSANTGYILGTPHKLSWTASLTRKTRVGANPFGFGLTNADLSIRQLSILTALGISRL